MQSLWVKLCALALPLLAAATSPLLFRQSGTLQCCPETVNPVSPQGEEILDELGLSFLDPGTIGINCEPFSLEGILNGTCTTTDVFECSDSFPLFNDTISVQCQPASLL